MADNIRVDSAQLSECAGKYTGAMETLVNAVDKLVAAIDCLDADWTGKAEKIMAASVRVIAGKISRSVERCDDAIKELNVVANITDEAEAKEKSRVSGLETVQHSAPFQG